MDLTPYESADPARPVTAPVADAATPPVADAVAPPVARAWADGRVPRPELEALGSRYRIVQALGRGGCGAVYLAEDLAAGGRPVAIKLLLDHAGDDGAQRARFLREGQVTASLDHPGIVRVHATGEAAGRPFIVYEYVEGCRTLSAAFRDLDLPGRVRRVIDAARALGHAHRHGVTHRDVKPENLLVDAAGRLRVADFGLASLTEASQRLTETGMSLGTPTHMAPEQVLGLRAAVGPASDVWALGVVLHEALTGRLPFDGRSALELAAQVCTAAPRPFREDHPEVTAPLEAVCLRALAQASRDRPPDGDAFADLLERALRGEPIEGPPGPARRRRRLAAGALALGGGAALAAVLALRRGAPDAAPPTLDVAPVPAEVLGDAVEVVGVARDADSPWVEVSAGRRTARVAPGERFTLRVPLSPGPNPLRIEAVDASGRRAPGWGAVVVRRAAPAWYDTLAPAGRPPLPLPPGVVFGAAPREYVAVADGSTLVFCPPGILDRRRPDPAASADEHLAGRVRFSRGFFIGKHEVTRRQWAGFCAAVGRPASPPELAVGPTRLPTGDDHPIVGVSLAEAAAYCAWAGLRLPTEAEWEYAASGGDGRPWPWGDASPGPERANLRGAVDGWPGTSPVGAFPAGAAPFGGLDMAGNAAEWVADGYAAYPAEELVDPPPLSAAAPRRVRRGGSWWSSGPSAGRCADRESCAPEGNTTVSGLRVARDLK